jgi:GxxExxY protein
MRDQMEQKQTKGTKMKKHRLFFVLFVCFCSFVHPLYPRVDKLSYEVIGAAIEVHRLKGPGLIESIYEKCVGRELSLRNITAVTQRTIQIEYKGLMFEEPLRFDMLVEDCLLLELKAVQEVLPIHKAQLFSYMKLLNIPLGLLINFHEMKLTDGITRMILPGANT